mmetsp:Transcript_41287/g.61123  ORF Transcript_41287/g.61123 Transcript_41287/m.61123 type:complete len:92 (+) Transcript_41287:516-791(+)
MRYYDILAETAKEIESRLWVEAGGDIGLYQDRTILAARMGEVAMPEYRSVVRDDDNEVTTSRRTTMGTGTTAYNAATPTATSVWLTDNRYR